MSESGFRSGGPVVGNTLESTAALLAEIRSMVCKALDKAESRLLEMWAAEEKANAKAEVESAST